MSASPSEHPLVDGLSVVLPALDEEECVAEAVDRALRVLPELARSWEVIVVDDGSCDRTPEILTELVEEHYPRVRQLRHDRNLGYGAALRSGFAHARYGLVFYTDSDNQFDIAELAHALPLMANHDVLIGFRVYRYDPPVRLVASWGYNMLVRILFRVRVRDVDCAFKVFRREVLEKIDIETDNFFVDTELVAKARKWNFRLAEKGVRHYPRTAGETKIEAGDVPRTLRVVFQMWRRIHMPSRSQLAEAALVREQAVAMASEVVPERAARAVS